MTDQTMASVGQPLSQQQQAEIIKEMHDLLIYIEMNDAMLNNLKQEQGPVIPPKPVRQMINRVYPEMHSSRKANYIEAFWPFAIEAVLMVLGMFVFKGVGLFDFFIQIAMYGFGLVSIGLVIFYFVATLPAQRKRDEAAMRATPEYQAQCQVLDAQYDQQQAELDVQYQAACQHYQEATLPRYEAESVAWQQSHDQKVANVVEENRNMRERFEELSTTSKLVPLHYQIPEILGFIYNIVAYTNHDVEYAIAQYELSLDRQLQRDQNQALAEQAQAQWETVDAMNRQAKAVNRQSVVIGAGMAANAYEQHKRNKLTEEATRRDRRG